MASDRVPHAYLFCGPARSGKHATGLALAMAMNCSQSPGEGCGRCEPCEKIAGGIHPDVRTLEREGAAQIIPIESIRKHVLAQIGLPPHEARARIYLIDEAGALQGPAANALLKTLEEPPARTHFILCTTAPDQLLPTIRSRCQRVSFAALPPDARAELAPDDDSRAAVAKLTEVVDRLETALEPGSPLELHGAALAATQDKTETVPVLQMLAVRLHERARAAAMEGALGVAASLSRCARMVLETEMTVAVHNAHGQLAFDNLLRRLRDGRPATATPAPSL